MTLWKDGKRKMFMLHKLISQTFQVPEEDVKKALSHKPVKSLDLAMGI